MRQYEVRSKYGREATTLWATDSVDACEQAYHAWKHSESASFVVRVVYTGEAFEMYKPSVREPPMLWEPRQRSISEEMSIAEAAVRRRW
ncbi:MAG: hypothetical protein QM729_21240 [Solirubrobacterales bacterium]